MSRTGPLATLVACLLVAVPPARAAAPAGTSPDAALAAMVETERAFAALAVAKGMREAFITYIAEDGVGFDNGPIPLRQAMRDRPAGPESFTLIWEPRYGDVAASGEVGYLTGPYRVEGKGKDGAPFTRHGCFFSVWRRQADGEFRNIVDIGVRLPGEAAFEPGFKRAPHADRSAGMTAAITAGPAGAEVTLRAADQALDAAARSGTLREALGAVLDPHARLHREGVMPAAGAAAGRKLLEGAGRLAEAETRFVGMAQSGDLGWSYGRYAFAPAGAPSGGAAATPERGSFARVWARDHAETWRVVADIASPDREAP